MSILENKINFNLNKIIRYKIYILIITKKNYPDFYYFTINQYNFNIKKIKSI